MGVLASFPSQSKLKAGMASSQALATSVLLLTVYKTEGGLGDAVMYIVM